jgi:hypothetical protein
MAKPEQKSKRANRAIALGDAIGPAMDPVFRKRGFASRDLVANWPSMAPSPYDKVSIPDRLHWPRTSAGAEGAVLFLRCAPSHRLQVAHESDVIAGAVNRYFGYVLVGAVKLSANAFTPGSGDIAHNRKAPAPATTETVEQALDMVEDEGLKQALRKLGHGVLGK